MQATHGVLRKASANIAMSGLTERLGMIDFTRHPIVLAGESHVASLCGWETNDPPSLAPIKGINGLYCFRGTWPRQNDYYEKLIYTVRLNKNVTPVLFLRGNDHLASFLLQSAEPIDFVSSRFPNLSLDMSARIVAEDLIEERFYNLYKSMSHHLTAITENRIPFFSVATPPPKKSEDFLRRVLAKESHFREAVERRGLSISEAQFTPPNIRLKLWNSICCANERVTREAGGVFLRLPPEATDEEGFLKERFYGSDCTHASYEYGDVIIKFVHEHLSKNRGN